MSRIKTLLEAQEFEFEDYEYQYNEWKLEKLKQAMMPNEYEVRILEENQISKLYYYDNK